MWNKWYSSRSLHTCSHGFLVVSRNVLGLSYDLYTFSHIFEDCFQDSLHLSHWNSIHIIRKFWITPNKSWDESTTYVNQSPFSENMQATLYGGKGLKAYAVLVIRTSQFLECFEFNQDEKRNSNSAWLCGRSTTAKLQFHGNFNTFTSVSVVALWRIFSHSSFVLSAILGVFWNNSN